ncbi:MAG: Hsp33 family molecular chaperone [Alphaproteobacteria bacterium]
MPEGDQKAGGTADDLIQPFQIESHSLRGRLVRLGPAIDAIISAHDYPEPVATLLGETVTLAALFADAMKFEGILTIQTKSDGPVNLLVADVTSTGDIRGYAGFDEAKLAAALEGPVEAPVPMLLGAGYLAFTVDQGRHTERYQGIVELNGATLADCAHHYFRQSEQLDAAIQLAAGRVGPAGTDGESGESVWRAGGMMLQHLPPEGGKAEHNWDMDAQRDIDGWRETVVLMGTVKSGELLGPRLRPHDLLYRLFHEVGVRAFQTKSLVHSCRCSREKVATTLASLPRKEIEDCKEEGTDEVVVTCQFCNASYRFDDDALAALYESEA